MYFVECTNALFETLGDTPIFTIAGLCSVPGPHIEYATVGNRQTLGYSWRNVCRRYGYFKVKNPTNSSGVFTFVMDKDRHYDRRRELIYAREGVPIADVMRFYRRHERDIDMLFDPLTGLWT